MYKRSQFRDNNDSAVSYLDSPIVQQTLHNFYRPKTPITHTTSAMSNWRAVVALDSPQQKAARISKII